MNGTFQRLNERISNLEEENRRLRAALGAALHVAKTDTTTTTTSATVTVADMVATAISKDKTKLVRLAAAWVPDHKNHNVSDLRDHLCEMIGDNTEAFYKVMFRLLMSRP